MYKVTVKIQDNVKKKEMSKVFELGAMDTSEYHDQMNDLADYLYELDIPFDVDADGDMMIDDILMSVSEEETFEKAIKTKKKNYTILGTIEA